MGLRGPKPRRKQVFWSAELAYAIGLIATDGCLSNDGRHLTLVSKDLEQIENLKRCLSISSAHIRKSLLEGTKGKIQKYYRIQWGDITLYNFLLSIGLTPNKSLTIENLAIPGKYFFDFLRGHHDGDGSFYSYFDPRWRSSFMFYLSFVSASKKHIRWLQNSVSRLCDVKGHLTHTGKGNQISSLRYAKREALEVLKRMYPSREVVCLSRKRLKIEKALRIVGKSLE